MAAIVLLQGAACTKREPIKNAPYSFDMSVSGFELPSQGAEIIYDETVLGRIKPQAPVTRVTLPDDVYLVDTRGRLRVRVDGTCGKQEIPLRIPFTDQAQEARVLRTEAQTTSFESENVALIKVYYDNEDGPRTSIALGALQTDIPANDRGVLIAVLGSCATARQVMVAGARVGDLPASNGPSVQPVNVAGGMSDVAALVDLKGGRCYRRSLHIYSSTGEDKTLLPPSTKAALRTAKAPGPKASPRGGAASASSVLGQPPGGADLQASPPVFFKGERVYAVGIINDFLTAAPEKLVIRDDARFQRRVELIHCEDAAAGNRSGDPPSAAAPTPGVANGRKGPARGSAPVKKRK